jgi:hypothetical protein
MRKTADPVDELLAAEIARQVRHTARMKERAGPLEFEPRDLRGQAPEEIPEPAPEPEPPLVAARSSAAIDGIWSGPSRAQGARRRPPYSIT